jgi:hypothetical protein
MACVCQLLRSMRSLVALSARSDRSDGEPGDESRINDTTIVLRQGDTANGRCRDRVRSIDESASADFVLT